MIAFVCNTPVQVLRAVHMNYSMKVFSNMADIYICDNFLGADKLVENINKIDLFKRAYLIRLDKQKKAKTANWVFGISTISRMLRKKHYTKLVSFNIDNEFANAIYNISKRNKSFEYHCVEDAPGLYPLYKPTDYNGISKLLGLQKCCFHIKKWWFSQPELMDLPDNIQADKAKLPPISKDERKFVQTVNSIFEFIPDTDFDKADVIIMEESFYTDGRMKDNADLVLFEEIRSKYPDKSFVVKLHPRTRVNRFQKKFVIMKNTWIPWEVYLLNQNERNKSIPLQLGIICTSMSSDKFLFDQEGKKITMAPLFSDKVECKADGSIGISDADIQKFLNIKGTYQEPEHFQIIYTKNELFQVLDKMIR